MKDGRANNGGKRIGAGRPKKETEHVKNYTVSLYPSEVKRIKEKYGSLRMALKNISLD